MVGKEESVNFCYRANLQSDLIRNAPATGSWHLDTIEKAVGMIESRAFN